MSIQAKFKGQLGDFALDVGFKVPNSGIIALFGPSGSGKTTVLRAMSGLQKFERGRFEVRGQTWQDDGQFVPPHQRPVGYVFQESSLFPHLDVSGNLAYAQKRASARRELATMDTLVEWLDIRSLLHRNVSELSGGERKRVAIARALASAPQLLLLDEPMAGLDEPRKQKIMPLLQNLHRRLSLPIFLVTHDVREVAQLADHMISLDSGRVTSAGSVASELASTALPGTGQGDTLGLMEARVHEHHPQWQLTELRAGNEPLWVPFKAELNQGDTLRVAIAARDVSLTLSRSSDSSILNILPATVDSVQEGEHGEVLVGVSTGTHKLSALITRQSLQRLGIKPGLAVFAQAKSVAVLA